MTKFYLEPIGFVYGKTSREAQSNRAGLALAGTKVTFTQVRIWERCGQTVSRKIVPLSALYNTSDPALQERLRHLTSLRPLSCCTLDFADGLPKIMGILNVTPDSFSDGGDHESAEAAIQHGLAMAAHGADIIDVGGESTRPGAKPVRVEEELDRVMPVIKALSARKLLLSIDTRKPEVMEAACEAGAALINDVSALGFSLESTSTALRLQRPVVLMHAKGTPEHMQDNPIYENVVLDVYDELERRLNSLETAGLTRDRMMVDPGFGFGKTVQHNLALLESVGLFHGLGCLIVTGLSRKRTIQTITGANNAKDALPGSLAAALKAASAGVQVLRVHDVLATRQALSFWFAE